MMRAALLGPYAPRFACGLLPDIDATATIAPRAALSAGWAALARSQVARVFTAKTRSQSSTEYCRSAPGRLIPALLTSPSRPPKRPTASATTCAGASALPMSACRGRASASSFPRSAIRLSSSRNGTKSTAAIFAAWPRARASRARRRHVARPIPLAAPVTSTRMRTSSGRSVPRTRSVDEAVEPARVLADDLLSDVGRQVPELTLDDLTGVGPDAVGVGEVRAPHDVVDPNLVEQLDADAIRLVGRLALAAPVLARSQAQSEVLELVLPFRIHALEDVRDPADAALADDDP